MKQLKLLTLSLIAALGIGFAAAPIVLADTPTNEACAGIGLTGGNGCGNQGIQFSADIQSAINIFSFIIGVVVTIMVMWAGFKFITSRGDPGKVAGAKSTLTYALIGVAIVALAQVIVHFVLTNIG